ncbi:glutamine-hydrolyzing carbamoyl-phosphate synthase small subunit [candidate division GN15 bacterium]|nr:glutamine-hydrolyzing carbamoyl-phosphate synthase small subunit [candidate division GN15 bacterium]
MKKATLVLEDGSRFDGVSVGRHGAVGGEVVFNTGMVGYPECLTDPSYCGQILVTTYPLIGNYGVPCKCQDQYDLPQSFESPKMQVSGLVVSEMCHHYSHYTADRSLPAWLVDEGVPAIAEVDTRAITRLLREKGSMLGKIVIDGEDAEMIDPNVRNMAAQVCVDEPVSYTVDKDAPTLVLIDCGVKANIIRSLLKRGFNVVRVPHDHYFLNINYDGLVVSNGPGDPRTLTTTIKNVERALAVGKPTLGICMGIQILALAVGADTYKLKFGHRGHNQPCIELMEPVGKADPEPGRCYITSQNHGYAIRGDSLPGDWRVWFVNANDQTVAGIKHVSRPVSAVQFHPEATPGPRDTDWIFDDFAKQVKSCCHQ